MYHHACCMQAEGDGWDFIDSGPCQDKCVGKCLGTAVTAVRPIIDICIPMMSKKEGFYLQEMHA